MAKEVVLVDLWTSPRASHILRKRAALRVRWRAVHVRARDREGARERDREGNIEMPVRHLHKKSTCLPSRLAPRMPTGLPGRLSTRVSTVYPRLPGRW